MTQFLSEESFAHLLGSHLAILKHRPWGQDGLFCGADWPVYTSSYQVCSKGNRPQQRPRSQKCCYYIVKETTRDNIQPRFNRCYKFQGNQAGCRHKLINSANGTKVAHTVIGHKSFHTLIQYTWSIRGTQKRGEKSEAKVGQKKTIHETEYYIRGFRVLSKHYQLHCIHIYDACCIVSLRDVRSEKAVISH